jgi:hypothetical protein
MSRFAKRPYHGGNIYFINSMPVGWKGIMINDMRLSRVTAKRLTSTMDAIQVITPLIDNQSINPQIWIRTNSSIAIEALRVLKNLIICLAKGYNNM